MEKALDCVVLSLWGQEVLVISCCFRGVLAFLRLCVSLTLHTLRIWLERGPGSEERRRLWKRLRGKGRNRLLLPGRVEASLGSAVAEGPGWAGGAACQAVRGLPRPGRQGRYEK